MKAEQRKWTAEKGWEAASPATGVESAELALVFGAIALLRKPELLAQIRNFYPSAHLIGCSTAGEICDTEVADDSIVVTAIRFEHTQVRKAEISLRGQVDSFIAGEALAQVLPRQVNHPISREPQRLAHVFVLSDGSRVNGSELVRGLEKYLCEDISVTGGLAGGGEQYGETLVFRDNIPSSDTIAAIGLYGNQLKIGYGSLGGWDPFGPERLITRSTGNVLYTLDGHSALGLYKKYLGRYADGLPGVGVLFPLSVRTGPGERPVARAVQSIDETDQSMTFAGDIPEGSYARLMKANLEHVIEGANGAALASREPLGPDGADLAILVSCVARKLALKQRVEEEVEEVRNVLGDRTVLAGFYSNGEIAPFSLGGRCELHNQTMTITTLAEA